jgi:hypothetical protein
MSLLQKYISTYLLTADVDKVLYGAGIESEAEPVAER